MSIFGPYLDRDERAAYDKERQDRRLSEDLHAHMATTRRQREEILRLAHDNVLLHNIFSMWQRGGVTWEWAVNEAIKALVLQNSDLLKTVQKKFMLQPAAVLALRCEKCGHMPSMVDIPGVTPAPSTSPAKSEGEIVCIGKIPGIDE